VHRFDDIDVHILKELQRDSSRTNVELARAVGLSPPACLRRVRRLRKSGAIRGEMAVLDPRLVGPALTVVVAVDMASEGREALAAFRARVLAESAVAQCWYVTGRHDFILVVRVPDLAAYEALGQRLFEADPNVKKSESLVVLDELKRDLAVPVRVRSTG
jgi:Lrp/AsnC family transcriptional regulator, leucine-responsive regulatory protein